MHGKYCKNMHKHGPMHLHGTPRVEMTPKRIASFKAKKMDAEDVKESTSLWSEEGFEKD